MYGTLVRTADAYVSRTRTPVRFVVRLKRPLNRTEPGQRYPVRPYH